MINVRIELRFVALAGRLVAPVDALADGATD
jgi:hypothetical protein